MILKVLVPALLMFLVCVFYIIVDKTQKSFNTLYDDFYDIYDSCSIDNLCNKEHLSKLKEILILANKKVHDRRSRHMYEDMLSHYKSLKNKED